MLLTLLPVTAFAEEDSQATTDAASEGDVSANEEGEGNGEAPKLLTQRPRQETSSMPHLRKLLLQFSEMAVRSHCLKMQ